MFNRILWSIVVVSIASLFAATSVGCTENERARSYGGTQTINLATGSKLVNLTWKETNLWVLVTKRPVNEAPQTYEFHEKSNLGIVEGTIVVVEH